MFGILYVIIFAFTIVIEVQVVEKSKTGANKAFWIIAYFVLMAIGIFVGGFLGNLAGEIYARKHAIFDVGFGHLTGGAMHGFVFIPFFVLLFVNLYKSKKINLGFTIIFILETLGISLGAFFLLLIS